MADEKTNPTPKVGVTDTMHSTPGTPDRSKGEGMSPAERHAARVAERDADSGAPPNVNVGSEIARNRTVRSLDDKSGTLVERLLPPDSEEHRVDTGEPVNPGNPAPEEPVALQPGEDPTTTTTAKQFGEKGRDGASKSKSGTKTPTRSAKTGEPTGDKKES